VNRVVQKASFQNPNFIGFFAPISEIRAGPLATVWKPAFDAPHSTSIYCVSTLQHDAVPHKSRPERHTIGLHAKQK
jgi:hypothetical protein